MSESKSSGGGIGCIPTLMACGALIAFVLYFGYGWEAEEAIWTGAKYSVMCWCGIPTVLALVIFVGFGVTWFYDGWERYWRERAERRWRDLE